MRTGHLLTIKSSMKAAYNDDYIPFRERACVSPVAYSTFTSIRKKHFPHLKKHKSFKRKNGLNHFLIFNSYYILIFV